MKLREHIDKNYDGNISEFARSIGKQRQQVQQYLRGDFYWIDGGLYQRKIANKNKG